jgi:two-component system LytT family sensor kinase
MSSSAPNGQRWLATGLYGGAWTLIGLISASQANLFWPASAPPPPSRVVLVVWQMAFWYGWGALTPVVLWLGRRFPFERRHWLRTTCLHLAASILAALLHMAYFTWTWRSVVPGGPGQLSFTEAFRTVAHQQLDFEWFIYWAVLGSGVFTHYYRRYRERELAAARLERQLAAAELQALKAQLQPHFLFNTLHAIAVLVRKHEDQAAIRMLSGVSDLLRYVLENDRKQEVPLKEELEFVQLYLEIQQIRFQDRLKVHMNIDPETLDAEVPSLILQPLVENAVRHGISARSAAGLVELTASKKNGELHLRIRDDGPGLTPNRTAGNQSGLGLANTRARLKQIYGSEYHFELTNVEDQAGGGAASSLSIPFRLYSQPSNGSGGNDGDNKGAHS